MKVQCTWNEQFSITAQSGPLKVTMDAKKPFGKEEAMTPKELLLSALGGCTMMDVIGYIKKYKQTLTHFHIDVDGESSASAQHPVVFSSILLTYYGEGSFDKKYFVEAITLSQSKFCGVSAMLSASVPIEYLVHFNNEEVYRGKSQF